MITLQVNGQQHTPEADPAVPFALAVANEVFATTGQPVRRLPIHLV